MIQLGLPVSMDSLLALIIVDFSHVKPFFVVVNIRELIMVSMFLPIEITFQIVKHKTIMVTDL